MGIVLGLESHAYGEPSRSRAMLIQVSLLAMRNANLRHETFDYRIQKDGLVRIFWEGRCVLALGGERGRVLAEKLAGATAEDTQRLLQRATGNFKRGNERPKGTR